MLSLIPRSTSSLLFVTPNTSHHRLHSHFECRPRRTNLPLQLAAKRNSSFNASSQDQRRQNPRTLFPGGYRRPAIKVPNLVLQLSCEEVLEEGSVLDVVDDAVSRCVGIVVLSDGVGGGGRLYEAACKLKSVIRERAYLLIAERVDIAAAVDASGVVLSDQGLPAIVARNTMIGSKSASVVLPLVARNVQDSDAALNASNSEGADFLLYRIDGKDRLKNLQALFSRA